MVWLSLFLLLLTTFPSTCLKHSYILVQVLFPGSVDITHFEQGHEMHEIEVACGSNLGKKTSKAHILLRNFFAAFDSSAIIHARDCPGKSGTCSNGKLIIRITRAGPGSSLARAETNFTKPRTSYFRALSNFKIILIYVLQFHEIQRKLSIT